MLLHPGRSDNRPMFRARRILRGRTLARTALVGAAAYYVAKRGARTSREKNAPPAPPPQPDASGRIEQITHLNELRGQGLLSDEEFTTEKKKLLGI